MWLIHISAVIHHQNRILQFRHVQYMYIVQLQENSIPNFSILHQNTTVQLGQLKRCIIMDSWLSAVGVVVVWVGVTCRQPNTQVVCTRYLKQTIISALSVIIR